MIRTFSLFFSLLLLVSCAGWHGGKSTSVGVRVSSGGEQQADGLHLYWLKSRGRDPIQLFEQVNFDSGDFYRSDYRWQDGVLRELLRQGETGVDGKRQGMTMHLRFGSDGQPLYQRYQLEDSVIPLKKSELSQIQKDAMALVGRLQEKKKGQSLLQGHITAQGFVPCGAGQVWPWQSGVVPELMFTTTPQFVLAIGRQLTDTKAQPYEIEQWLSITPQGECLPEPEWDGAG